MLPRRARNRRRAATASTSISKIRRSRPSPRSCSATSCRRGYTIDPRVQGTVSLVSVRPVPKSDIVFVLENALRLSGVVLVRDTSGYRLTPLGDAVGAGRVDAAGANPEPGYGVSVVPLQYVSAQTLLKLMDSFATKPGMVRADTTRNLLLIQGTGAERRTAVETATELRRRLDARSIGRHFPDFQQRAPNPIIAELEKIVDSGENGLSQNVVKFQPVARLNAVMVVTKKAACCAPPRPGSSGSIAPTPREPAFTSTR